MAEFLLLTYLLIAAMSMGSWGLFIAVVVVGEFMGRRFIEFRLSISAFGTIAWGLFSLASFNVATPDGSGGLITESYAALGVFGIAGAVTMGLFLLDSALKALSDESPTADRDLAEQV